MNEIGIVIYRKGIEPGTLTAQWFTSIQEGGTGTASGGPEKGFTGEYVIQYFLENGDFDAELELKIKHNGRTYELIWLKDGLAKARGIGTEVGECLAVSWQSIE